MSEPNDGIDNEGFLNEPQNLLHEESSAKNIEWSDESHSFLEDIEIYDNLSSPTKLLQSTIVQKARFHAIGYPLSRLLR